MFLSAKGFMEALKFQENLTADFTVSQEKIAYYLVAKAGQGIRPQACRKYRYSLDKLFAAFENKPVTAESLTRWRSYLSGRGYSKITIQRHITVVNDFLRFYGRNDLCAPRPTRRDLAGKKFGYLTAIEPTGEKNRNNIVWRCICKCGNEIDVPAARLLRGNTASCGCMNIETLQKANMYIEGTSLRKALRDNPVSSNASGYTGVYPKNGKWMATITYKGKRYNLGTYAKLEDAVKARRVAKEKVIQDATQLYNRLQAVNK